MQFSETSKHFDLVTESLKETQNVSHPSANLEADFDSRSFFGIEYWSLIKNNMEL